MKKANIHVFDLYFCSRKAISITYSECVAVVILHAMRMRGIILSSVACLPLPYFLTLSHKRHYLVLLFLNSFFFYPFFISASLSLPILRGS